ncbi:MAG: amino acid carrier protein [Planctomycetota bacterium]
MRSSARRRGFVVLSALALSLAVFPVGFTPFGSSGLFAQDAGEAPKAADGNTPDPKSEAAKAAPASEEGEASIVDTIDDVAGVIVGYMATVIFFDPVAFVVDESSDPTSKDLLNSAIVSLHGGLWLDPAAVVGLQYADFDSEKETLTLAGVEKPVEAPAAVIAWVAERGEAAGPLLLAVDDAGKIGTSAITAATVTGASAAVPIEAARNGAILALAGGGLGADEIAGATAVAGNYSKISLPLGGGGTREKELKESALTSVRILARRSAPSGQILSKLDANGAPSGPLTPVEVSTIIRNTRPGLKLVVLWLIFGAVTFTLLMGFINLRALRHAVDLVRGKFSDPSAAGEVSHFQALSAALSATVGLGNIAGVAVAVSLGGPGAVVWMVLSAFFGMSSKFVECTLGQKYRRVDAEGRVSGGAMHYLSTGLAEMGLKDLGQVLAVIFALLCIGGSFGGGNMFQANQSFEALASSLDLQEEDRATYSMVYGAVLAVAVALVIIGGIRRIATTASKIVPAMCAAYVLGSVYIILSNFGAIPDAVGQILGGAFSPEAIQGGFLGVLLIGVQRAAFSNEAGVGSAAIAHSAAKTDEPVREGIVALLEPFIDTIIVCTMTGLVITITGVYDTPEFEGTSDGSKLTVAAWRTAADGFPWILPVATVLFAYSTLISWSDYGERCWTYLFGEKSTLLYKLIFVGFVFIGAVIKLGSVIDFSDMMILGMAFPNLIGCLLLSGKVRSDLKNYWGRYTRGEFKTYD